MSSFDIDPGAVQTILTNVEVERTQLAEGIKPTALETDVGGLLNVPAPGVAAAVAEFIDLESPAVQSIGWRIAASMAGVSTVTRTYTSSSDEMLQNVQNEAINASESGDFAYFDA